MSLRIERLVSEGIPWRGAVKWHGYTLRDASLTNDNPFDFEPVYQQLLTASDNDIQKLVNVWYRDDLTIECVCAPALLATLYQLMTHVRWSAFVSSLNVEASATILMGAAVFMQNEGEEYVRTLLTTGLMHVPKPIADSLCMRREWCAQFRYPKVLASLLSAPPPMWTDESLELTAENEPRIASVARTVLAEQIANRRTRKRQHEHQQNLGLAPWLLASLSFVERLPPADRAVLDEWTRNHQVFLNDHASREEGKRRLKQIFLRAPRLTKPIVLYRGLMVNDAKEIHGSGVNPMATSTSLDFARSFAWSDCCVLKLTVPAGTPVIALQRVGVYAGESEVLLPPSWALKLGRQDRHGVIRAEYIPSELYAHGSQVVREMLTKVLSVLGRLVRPL